MKCEVLVSTMNRLEKETLIKSMNINNCVIINQITKEIYPQNNDNFSSQKFISYFEKGLSRSRNKGIENSTSDICIIADDDMYYVNNYEKIIMESYEKIPDADIIAFLVENEADPQYKKRLKDGRIRFLNSMKLSSVQITFKRDSILKNNIKVDEEFGTGSKYYWGEENIFLFDCLKKGMKVYYVPNKIATLRISESSWNKDSTPLHFQIQGAIYYRMTDLFYLLLILQFVVRKRYIYINDMSMLQVLNNMIKGAKEYKKTHKNGRKYE